MHIEKTKRAYQQQKQEELSDVCANNQVDFWKKLKNIGIKCDRKSDTPVTVKDSSGNMISDSQGVMMQWQSYFSDLLNGKEGNTFDKDHIEEVCHRVQEMEQEMDERPEEYSQLLNSDITLVEVRKAILSAKLKKACGSDNLYAEVFRNEASVHM